LFDLRASNDDREEADRIMRLGTRFERPVDDARRLESQATPTASLLRDVMRSMISELYSSFDVDFVTWSGENLQRLEVGFANLAVMERA
jgi:hypothetical protein